MWNRQHQGEIDEIVKAGRDPATTRLSDLRSSPAAPATAPVLKPSIENNDVGVRPGPNNPPPWIPPTGDTRTVRPGPNNPPPYVPLPLPQQALLQQMGLPTVGWGQAAAPPPSITAPPEQTGWTPPIDPSQVVGGGNKFGDAVSMEGTHMGTDLQAFKGTPALSPVDGRVETVKNEPSGLGLQVSIRDASGQVHTLAHLDRAQVQVGDRVQMGQPVAAVGESGAGATGPHLDYRIAGQDGTPINPEPRMGPLAQLPPHPNTVGEGQAKKGWTPKVGTGQTIDASIWQQQMDQQASQFSQQLSLQKQGLENDMAIAKMQHEVAMKNAATAQDQERENERYNFVSQQLQRQFKFIDAQISYAQMASSQNIVKMQIAGQLTATGMNNETALRQAEMQTAAQLAGTQMNNQTQLLTQGTFGQRTTADLMKTALTNPWLQQLSGMAPGYGAPGGPGASGGGGNGGIIGDLLQGWNAGPAPNEGVEGSSLFGTDYGSLYQSAMGHDIPMNTDWLQPSQLEPIQAKELYPKGLNIGFPRTTRQGLARPENADVGGGQAQGWEPPVGSGQGVGEQLAGGSGDVATWGPYAANAQNTGGWGGYAPIQNAPPVPTWQQWQAMSPFERTSYRTLVEMSEPWALGVQKMRLKWGAEGGPLETPGTTQLGWATRDPLGKIGVAQNAEVFGEKPEYYLQNQQKAWAAGSQPGVQMIT